MKNMPSTSLHPSAVLEVAAAVIQRPDGRFLLAERPEGKPWAGWWEFPGGKIEAGETPAHALARELHEELGIAVDTAHPWLTRVYAYPHATVRLHFFRVTAWRGEPHGRENQRFDWQIPGKVEVSPLLPANGPILKSLELPPLYGITNLAEMGEEASLTALDRALDDGLRLIQVREKSLPPDGLARFAAQVVERARPFGAKVLVNGDAEAAKAAAADGLHLPSRPLMGLAQRPDFPWCGASCHNAQELARAAELGLDYVLLSPVQPTPSHPGAPTLGWEAFAKLIEDYPLPVYALGGLTAADMETAWRHGAHGICLLRGAWQKA